jgi:hypothetical protein
VFCVACDAYGNVKARGEGGREEGGSEGKRLICDKLATARLRKLSE